MHNNEYAEVAERYRIMEHPLLTPDDEHFFGTLLCASRESFIRSFANCPDLVQSVAKQLREKGIEPRATERKDGEKRFDPHAFAKVVYPCADQPTPENQDALAAYASTHPGGLQELFKECKRSEALLNGVHEPRKDYFFFREFFVDHNRRLAYKVAKDFRKSYRAATYTLDELMNLALLGISNAADRYDINRGLRFSTFAMGQVEGAILHVIYPRREAEREHQWRIHYLADLQETAIPPAHAPDTIGIHEQAEHFASLTDILERIALSQNRTAKDILFPLYGIGEERKQTLSELGARMGVSRERIRQLKGQALARVRKHVAFRDRGQGKE
jgi:RNA polymerase sigma factor (sigma-70 family)